MLGKNFEIYFIVQKLEKEGNIGLKKKPHKHTVLDYIT